MLDTYEVTVGRFRSFVKGYAKPGREVAWVGAGLLAR
jgi:hypothetical protein